MNGLSEQRSFSPQDGLFGKRRTQMAKVEWSAGIDSVSGALSKPSKSGQHSCTKMLLGTHRVAATQSSDCNRLYLRKKTKRSTPVTENEMGARARFTTVRAAVKARSKNLSTISADQAAFEAQKNLADGKTTFNAYLWKVCGDEYDAAHPQG
ncbi:MAG: hypothetical protein IJQ32_01510 [Paludibacteraceae bacterium]|nr:hypothetical protein [Paludibacteraceae bacterium]